MSESTIQLNLGSGGPLLRSEQLTVGINTVQMEVQVIGDPTTSANLLGVDSSGRITVNLAPSSTVVLAAGSAVIGHVIVDSGTISTITNALPAGTNVIGDVVLSAQGTTQQTTQAPITFSASGANTLVAAVGGKTVRVWKLLLVVAGATVLTFQDTAAAAFTGAMTMTTGGSIVEDFDTEPNYLTTVGKGFAINSTNAVQVSGSIWYTQT